MRLAVVLLCLFSCSSTVFADKKTCHVLLREAEEAYRRAISVDFGSHKVSKNHQKQMRPKVICEHKGSSWRAITLYRAAIAMQCPKRGMSYLRLGLSYRVCQKYAAAACRSFARFRTACPKDPNCRRTRWFREKKLKGLLPFSGDVKQRKDLDGDGFHGCQKRKVFCSKDARITYLVHPGVQMKKGTCDCNDADPRIHPVAKERCDGKDNDCDGEIDEAKELFPPLCKNQKGVCRGAKRRCIGGQWSSCSATIFQKHNKAYESKETRCDGKDNDCDGRVDNQLKRPACTFILGVCKGAKQICMGEAGWEDCGPAEYRRHQRAYQSSETLCDGKDNNCDGQVDNIDNPPLCKNQQGVCRGSKQKCVAGKWRKCTDEDYLLNHSRYQPIERGCDNLDNDCDGVVEQNCLPWYPWLVAAAGGFAIAMGGLIRWSLDTPIEVSKQEPLDRPLAASSQRWFSFSSILIGTGSIAAVGGVGTGLVFLFMSLRGKKKRTTIKKSMKIPAYGTHSTKMMREDILLFSSSKISP
mgnify:CR=1 FL=1